MRGIKVGSALARAQVRGATLTLVLDVPASTVIEAIQHGRKMKYSAERDDNVAELIANYVLADHKVDIVSLSTDKDIDQ